MFPTLNIAIKAEVKTFSILIIPLVLVLLTLAVPRIVMAQDPYEKPDDTWISIDGTVESVTRDSFILDYGDGEIVVEMDDGDRDADAYQLIKGDNVTVSGMIDDDFFEQRTIEAGSVYVEKLDTHFFASSVDEEDAVIGTVYPTVYPIIVGEPMVSIQGTVTSVGDDEFRVNTGLRSVEVEVDEMNYNPLDNVGYQQIGPGDVVSVTGNIDVDFFEGRVLDAMSVTELVD